MTTCDVFVAIFAGLALVVVLVVGLSQAGGGDSGAASRQPLRPRQGAARAGRRAGAAGRAARPVRAAARAAAARPSAAGSRSSRATPWWSTSGRPGVRPCRTEFPIFQSVSVAKGKRVAFLGLNAGDSTRSRALASCARTPLPFPSYVDPDEKIAKSIQAPGQLPDHGLLRRSRARGVHPPGRLPKADLAADRRYLQ